MKQMNTEPVMHLLRAPEHLMERVEREVRIRRARLGATFPRVARQVGRGEEGISLFVFAGGGREEFFDERHVRLSLVWVVFEVLSCIV